MGERLIADSRSHSPTAGSVSQHILFLGLDLGYLPDRQGVDIGKPIYPVGKEGGESDPR